MCLSRGIDGLRGILHSLCFHCGKIRLKKDPEKAIDLRCGWFDQYYGHMTMKMRPCEECEAEIQEMREIAGTKSNTNSVWGSETRRRK